AGFSLEPRIFQSAWFRPHNKSEEVEHLYLVGAGTHPGAGVPSVIGSGTGDSISSSVNPPNETSASFFSPLGVITASRCASSPPIFS
ncbi:MAG: hypothetical protein EOM63_04405, partial [Clostridia bacterium]|nr:hypothetical protein [Clostridia bacterium]